MGVIDKITINAVAQTDNSVHQSHFGGNALHEKNVAIDGIPTENFGKSALSLGLSNLRYPGGMLEDICDLLENTTSSNLSPRLVNFLDWVKTQNANGASFTVTLGIPTKELFEKGYTASLYQEKVATFAKLIGKDYAGLVNAIEIGNEYSIGQTTINETTYGFRANIAAKSLAEGFQAAGLSGDNQPDILIQMAEIFGRGSDYKGGNHDGANTAIINQLSSGAIDAIDGVVNHYYYIKDHKGNDDFAAPSDTNAVALETRHLYKKIVSWQKAWESVSDKELGLHFTEWNVQKNLADQLGLKGAGTLLKQFSYMIDMGVDSAHVWPIQHKTPNSIAGNPDGTGALKPTGALFQMLSDSLRSQNETAPMKILDLTINDDIAAYETIGFQNDHKTVLYIASRNSEFAQLSLNLQGVIGRMNSISALILGYDPLSSDGLNEMADLAGKNRVVKRKITYEEYQQLKTLVFFDDSKATHIKIHEKSDGTKEYFTYLPEFDDIIPKIADPKLISDYYFATENDVDALIKAVASDELKNLENIRLNLNPFEIVQITIHHDAPLQNDALHIEATIRNLVPQGDGDIGLTAEAFQLPEPDKFDLPINLRNVIGSSAQLHDDTLVGGTTDDILHAGSGWDFIDGGEGHDTLYGGAGNDRLFGGLGNDFLFDGLGSDLLYGGEGADVFVFSDFHASEIDRVCDFNVEEDRLVLQGAEAANQLGRFSAVRLVDNGPNLEIVYDNYRIILEGVNHDGFDFGNIIFVS